MQTFNKQKGVALITALFIMAITAIAATAMTIRLQIGIKKTELNLTADKLFLIAEGVPDWAKGVLIKNYATHAHKKNSLIDELPQSFAPIKYGAATVQGQLLDEQALFNLNNLTNPKNAASFIILLQTTTPQLSLSEAKNIANHLVNWLQPITAGEVNPAIMQYYLKQTPPYRAGHQLMVSISELRLVEGVTPQIYQNLKPYITALPQITKININTAPVSVLMTLGAGLTQQQAETIVAKRNELHGFKNIPDFNNDPELAKLAIPTQDITVTSQYFMTKAYAQMDKQTIALNTLLYRYIKNNKAYVTTFWQSRGTL